MEYRIVNSSSKYKLEEEVKYLIRQGWVPQGGVSVVFSGMINEDWSQAMTKVRQ